MGEHRAHMYLLATLCTSLSKAAPVSDNLVVLVQPSVLVQRNSTTTLPCWLSSPQSTEHLEVRWYRDHFDTPIMLYQAQTLAASQEANYKGRVSFGLKDAASGGLKAGDVSLKLVDAMIEDAGDYTCYVSSDQGYDKGSVRLSVTETGSAPFLSVEWKEGDKVNVSCESTGWYPQPKLQWSDQKQDLNPKHLIYSNSSSGVMSVQSWLLVSSSSEVSCSVGLSDGEGKVARLRLENPPHTAKQDSGSTVDGWVAFAILLILALALAVAGLLYLKKRALFFWKKNESQRDQVDGENLTEALLKYVPRIYAEASEHYVNVVIHNEDSKYVTIKDCKVRDKQVDFPDGSRVTSLTAVRGTQGFSSGQHYWEVCLGNENTGLKQSWWVGVTSASSFTKPPCAPDCFWFLSSSPDRTDSFELNTEPKVFLPISSRPQTLGVYLNYDSGELSFFNVDDNSRIGSLYVRFTGEVFPLFNPGKGDKAPLEILHKQVQDKHSDAICNN